MKHTFVLAALLLSGGMSGAVAQCTTGQVTGSDITATLSGKLICAHKPTSSLPNDRWSEVHETGGNLTEWASGPGHPVDPSRNVGGWRVDETNSTVAYTYTGDTSSPYTWTLFRDVGTTQTLSFCNGAQEVAVVERIVDNPGGINPCQW